MGKIHVEDVHPLVWVAIIVIVFLLFLFGYPILKYAFSKLAEVVKP